jgi:hypothetical protein
LEQTHGLSNGSSGGLFARVPCSVSFVSKNQCQMNCWPAVGTAHHKRKTRYSMISRLIGLVLCLGPVIVAIASAVYALAHPEIPKLRVSLVGGLAAVVVLFNFHYSFTRPALYRLRHGSMEGYRFVSSFPIVGTVFLLIESILGFGSLYTALLVLFGYFLDTGGLPWLVVMTWRDRDFWR